jgi:hypothetical protein
MSYYPIKCRPTYFVSDIAPGVKQTPAWQSQRSASSAMTDYPEKVDTKSASELDETKKGVGWYTNWAGRLTHPYNGCV